MVRVRSAVPLDLLQIMAVEEETFGSIGEDAMAAEAIMRRRIELCNSGNATWFWVAEDRDSLVGDIILQPTRLTPDECTSWEAATDGGTLRSTFALGGENLYVVSFAASAHAPRGTSSLLAYVAFLEWFRSGKRYFMFCSRMPGFSAAHQATGISPRDYIELRHADGGPRDPMLRLYWEMTGGAEPYRLLEHGFPPDHESGGHGVLFAADDPLRALRAIADKIYADGIKEGRRRKESR